MIHLNSLTAVPRPHPAQSPPVSPDTKIGSIQSLPAGPSVRLAGLTWQYFYIAENTQSALQPPQDVSNFKVIIVQCLTVKFSPQIFVFCQIFHLLFAQIHIWSFLNCTTLSIKFLNKTIYYSQHSLISSLFQARKKQLEIAASQQSMWCRFGDSRPARPRNCQTHLSDSPGRAAAGGWRCSNTTTTSSSSSSFSAEKYK